MIQAAAFATLLVSFQGAQTMPSIHEPEPDAPAPVVGRPFPLALFPRLGGGQGSLADFRGKKLLLIQFASW